MTDIRHPLGRQAEWQKARRWMSWSEKVRLVESLHAAIRQFRDIRMRERERHAATKEGEEWRGSA